MALSWTEEKYMVASQVACEANLMRKIHGGFIGQTMDPTVIYYDNDSFIKLFGNPIFHDRSSHIDIWYHHLLDCVQRWIMLLQYILTEE